MYRVSVEAHFDAAHYLRGYQGKCEKLHGHRYRVVACIQAGATSSADLAYDFTDLKKELKRLLERFDHTCLNEVSPFDQSNPSAENIARTVYEELSCKLVNMPEDASLESVTVWESPGSWVEYRPDR
jgi:6-pyruvoyltetrahydropterin/6-carboxytetrahydropterin synthase